MNSMKKIITSILVMALILGLAACGGSKTPAAPTYSSDELYEKYLNDEITATIDCNDFYGADYGDVKTISELVYGEGDELGEYFLNDVYYGYIDCGMDGEDELLVAAEFITPGDTDYIEEQFIVKAFGQDLKVLSMDTSGARYMTAITDTGYIYYEGSGGASSFYTEHSYMNAEGRRVFLYSAQFEYELSGAIIPDSFLPSGVQNESTWDYQEDGYEVDVYNFNYLGPEYDDRWDDYLRESYFVFYSPDGENIMPEEPEKSIYETYKIKAVTEDDLYTELYKHLEDLGVTEELVDGEPADLELMDSEAVEWLPKG